MFLDYVSRPVLGFLWTLLFIGVFCSRGGSKGVFLPPVSQPGLGTQRTENCSWFRNLEPPRPVRTRPTLTMLSIRADRSRGHTKCWQIGDTEILKGISSMAEKSLNLKMFEGFDPCILISVCNNDENHCSCMMVSFYCLQTSFSFN